MVERCFVDDSGIHSRCTVVPDPVGIRGIAVLEPSIEDLGQPLTKPVNDSTRREAEPTVTPVAPRTLDRDHITFVFGFHGHATIRTGVCKRKPIEGDVSIELFREYRADDSTARKREFVLTGIRSTDERTHELGEVKVELTAIGNPDPFVQLGGGT